MSKLWWVLLPLALGLAGFAVLWLRGRAPPRRVVNAASSLLLMVYLLVTAGLGLFWVAQQQLPVFDWHYLFGYATLLLLALHLVFNLPAAWRALVRRPAPTPSARLVPPHRPAAAGPAAGRRRWLGAVVLLGTAVSAFMAGRRLGYQDGRLAAAADAPPQPATGPDAAQALAFVERFHALTSHARAGLLLRPPGLAWRQAPAAFKRYPDAERLALPAADGPPAVQPGPAMLGQVLWHAAGVTARQGGLALRASPSSGALFSTELYVAVSALPGVGAGLWHYDARDHALERLAGAAPSAASLGAAPALLDGAVAVVLATAVFARTGRKYRDRAYRYVLADLGHLLENLRAVAEALGLRARLASAFDEAQAAALLALDEREEGVLALLALGGPDAGDRPWAPWATPLQPSSPAQRTPSPFAADGPPRPAVPAPWPRLDVDTPDALTAEVHRATSWRLATGPLREGAPASPPAPPPDAAAATAGVAPGPPRPLPPRQGRVPTPAVLLRQLAGRRSQRRFVEAPLPLAALARLLEGLQLQTALLSPALRVDVVVHRVAGLAAGAYRYDPVRHALLPRRATAGPPSVAGAAGLDQDVIGEAAALFVISADRSLLARDPAGPARGYRHALLEAGLVGERVYLGAAAEGLGCCGVGAFYDDEAAALVGADPALEWVLHFAALGPVPA